MRYLKLFEEFNDLVKFNSDDLKNEKILLEEFFNNNSELNSIGTIDQYREYLGTIFPNSKVSGIWQHISNRPVFDFTLYGGGNFGKGYYFSKIGDDYIKFDKNKYFRHFAKLNVSSPRLGVAGEGSGFINKRLSDKYGSEIEFYPGDPEYREVENELVEINKKNCDAIIGDKNGYLESEIALFDKEKIHLLGSTNDIDGFKKFVSKK